VGGGTGLIGDPSFKSDERQLLSVEQVMENAEGIHKQLERFLDFTVATNPARMRNNYDWLGALNAVEFLRDTGKHFSVNQMLRKDSVRRRLEDEDTGISFTEFSYMLLQSYDFVELARREGCTVQIGGSDQWGNITAGIDLIRRVLGTQAFGATFPLLMTAAGTKFGKTEAGSVWLDAERTSPFRFYQFWINSDDRDAVRLLKLFSLFGQAEVDELAAKVESSPQERAAQKALADDVTRRVHGADGLARAQRATAALFGGDLEGLSGDDIADVFADVSSSEVARDALGGEGKTVIDLIADAGVAPSRGEAKRAIEGGGIYVNNSRVDSLDKRVTANDAIEGRFLVIRKGKKSYHLVKLMG
jgi:tyrosyl-tRNA synthetase